MYGAGAMMCERAAASNNRPSPDLSPKVSKARACGGARDRSGAFLNPNGCKYRRKAESRQINETSEINEADETRIALPRHE